MIIIIILVSSVGGRVRSDRKSDGRFDDEGGKGRMEGGGREGGWWWRR